MTQRRRRHSGSRGSSGFTLVELLVVIGIIALLMGMLLPAMSRARHQARSVACAANMRQVGEAMFVYVAQCRKFPPNIGTISPAQVWIDADRVGGIIAPEGLTKNSAMTCPEDVDAIRSYSMNLWMSSKVDQSYLTAVPKPGELWGSAPANVILLVEAWSITGSESGGWKAPAFVGGMGDTPGQRFGAGGGISPVDAGRWGLVNSEITFERHRPPGMSAKPREAKGAANFAFADGHVELRASGSLADFTSGKSTLDCLWSPLDVFQSQ